MSMTKREWHTAQEKAYLDAVDVMKSIKEFKSADQIQSEPKSTKIVERFVWGALLLIAVFVGAKAGSMDGYKKGFDQGYKDALYKRPASEDLEMVCAGLWVGQENAKYIKQEMNQNAKRTK